MTIYAVHCSSGEAEPTRVAERTVLLRLGFSVAALVFGPLWLLARRLWRALALWLVGAVLVGFALAHGALSDAAAFWLYVLSALYLGVEGRALQGAALTRRGRPLVDVVCARDSATAERDFFARGFPGAASRGGPRPAAPPPPPPPPSAPPDVVGMFPQAGR